MQNAQIFIRVFYKKKKSFKPLKSAVFCTYLKKNYELVILITKVTLARYVVHLPLLAYCK